MVRTRTRNKTRKVTIDYGSDGEPPDAHDDPEDDAFEAPPSDPEDDKDDRMDMDGDDDDFDDPSELTNTVRPPTDDVDDYEDEQPAYTSSAGLRKRPTDAAVLEPYHADGRPTRYYAGALKRGQHIRVLDFFYGPYEDAVATAGWVLNRWAGHGILPSKLPEGDACPIPSPWVEEAVVEGQNAVAREWFASIRDLKGVGEGERAMSEEEAKGYRLDPGGHLLTLLGPYPEQQKVKIAPYEGIVFSDAGLPLEADTAEEEKAAGWMFDVGGIVVGMDWAVTDQESQLLALGVVPHTDHEFGNEDAYDKKKGIIQLWELRGRKDEKGVMCPKSRPARLARTICLDYGRARRLKWCPFLFTENGSLGLLAVLSEDGQVHVVSVKQITDDEQDSFTKLEHPIVSLGLPSETKVEATCFAWINANRIVIGHSDGSLTLWSVSPRACLARHDVHGTYVIHIATAHPSSPYLVASTPVAGYTTLVDLADPECERASFPCFTISPQPNLLQWSDHLRGFFTVVPSANPLNASVGFVHSRWYAAQVRKAMDGDCLPTCLAVGSHHPFILVGYLDGSVWAANPASRIFASKNHYGHKVKVVDHQHVPGERLPASEKEERGGGCRGLSRLLAGFAPVLNVNPKVDTWKTKVAINKKKGKKGKSKAKAKAKADAAAAAEEENGDVQGGQEEGDGHFADPKRLVLSEPLTRVTTVAWNPNKEFSCWAAAAMASGLVRVLDLGVEF